MISGYSGRTKPKPGAQIDPAHPLSKGLVGYWLFNEGAGSRANDISGYGNHGTLKNMAPNAQNSGWVGSKLGGALNFDGTDDCINCGIDSSLGLTAEFTIVCTIKPATINNYDTIIGKSVFRWHLGLHGNSGIQVYVNNANELSTPANTIIVENEYHVVWVHSQSYGDLIFIDGVESASGDLPDVGADPTQLITIGADNGAGGYRYHGNINHVMIYDRALSESEIEQLYQDPSCNLLTSRHWYIPTAGPAGAIMNQFQNFNIGADLYNGGLIA
jgi:hypothetical protein